MLGTSLSHTLLSLEDDSLTKQELKTLQRRVINYLNDNLPRKYGIFPQKPEIYTISNSVCIKLPSFGNPQYCNDLYLLEKKIRRDFKCDVELYDGYTTFIIKEPKVHVYD